VSTAIRCPATLCRHPHGRTRRRKCLVRKVRFLRPGDRPASIALTSFYITPYIPHDGSRSPGREPPPFGCPSLTRPILPAATPCLKPIYWPGTAATDHPAQGQTSAHFSHCSSNRTCPSPRPFTAQPGRWPGPMNRAYPRSRHVKTGKTTGFCRPRRGIAAESSQRIVEFRFLPVDTSTRDLYYVKFSAVLGGQNGL
jgi:hypothetical protein